MTKEDYVVGKYLFKFHKFNEHFNDSVRYCIRRECLYLNDSLRLEAFQ